MTTGTVSGDGICEVVVTAPDAQWLAGFTRRLVEDRLAACGHQTAAIRSIYRWDGAVHDEPEARVALHTRVGLVERIVARADAEHPYDVPCVIALPIVAASPAYRGWVLAQTAQADRSARVSSARSVMPSATRASAPPSWRSITQSA